MLWHKNIAELSHNLVLICGQSWWDTQLLSFLPPYLVSWLRKVMMTTSCGGQWWGQVQEVPATGGPRQCHLGWTLGLSLGWVWPVTRLPMVSRHSAWSRQLAALHLPRRTNLKEDTFNKEKVLAGEYWYRYIDVKFGDLYNRPNYTGLPEKEGEGWRQGAGGVLRGLVDTVPGACLLPGPGFVCGGPRHLSGGGRGIWRHAGRWATQLNPWSGIKYPPALLYFLNTAIMLHNFILQKLHKRIN